MSSRTNIEVVLDVLGAHIAELEVSNELAGYKVRNLEDDLRRAEEDMVKLVEEKARLEETLAKITARLNAEAEKVASSMQQYETEV